jgi:putative flippase GtrA
VNNIAIVIPVYNEADNITQAIKRIEEADLPPHTISIVYDTDEDTTIPVALELQKTNSAIELVKNKYGRGVLNAIKTGLEEAQTEYVVVTMADLSDPPAVINEMYAIAEAQQAAIVCASRYMKGGKQIGGPPLKGILSRIAGITLHQFAGLATHDATNSFKLYRASFLRTQTIESSGGFEIGLELVAKAHVAGCVIAETPTTWTDRVAGKSNFRLLAWLGNYLRWYFYAFKGGTMERFVKYVAAGFSCALVNWTIFYVLNYIARFHYLAAAAAAFVVSSSVNYALCRLIFTSRGRKRTIEYLFVLIASAFALSIDLGVMYALIEKLSLPRMVAKILGTGSGFFFNWASRQYTAATKKEHA